MENSATFPLTPKERENIQFLIGQIATDPDLLALFRFGSSVSIGQYRDIDLCIVAKQKPLPPKKEIKYRIMLPEQFDVHFFHQIPLYIRHEVLREGVLEYNKDYNELFSICEETVRAFDLFKPKYRRYLEWIAHGR